MRGQIGRRRQRVSVLALLTLLTLLCGLVVRMHDGRGDYKRFLAVRTLRLDSYIHGQ